MALSLPQHAIVGARLAATLVTPTLGIAQLVAQIGACVVSAAARSYLQTLGLHGHALKLVLIVAVVVFIVVVVTVVVVCGLVVGVFVVCATLTLSVVLVIAFAKISIVTVLVETFSFGSGAFLLTGTTLIPPIGKGRSVVVVALVDATFGAARWLVQVEEALLALFLLLSLLQG